MKTREIENWYYDDSDNEHLVVVEVYAEGPHSDIETEELPEMPHEEKQRLIERLAELYWAAEREEHEMRQCAQEDSRDE